MLALNKGNYNQHEIQYKKIGISRARIEPGSRRAARDSQTCDGKHAGAANYHSAQREYHANSRLYLQQPLLSICHVCQRYSHTNRRVYFPRPAAAKLNAASYGGSWSAASVVANPDGSWTAIGGANWVSTTTANSGVENANESDAWRLFRASFNIANFNTVTGANIQIAADNAFELYLNGSLIATTATWNPAAPVYGTGPGPSGTTVPFEEAATYSLPVQQGANTLMFVVRNWDNSGQGNPSGLLYKVTIRYGVAAQQLNPTVYSGAGAWTEGPCSSRNWLRLG